MSDDTSTSVDDLFADETPPADENPQTVFDGTVAEFKDAVAYMPDDELATYADGVRDDRSGVVKAAQSEIERRSEPADDELTDDEPIDNAVNIRRLDWECVCGNTNTLDLQRCGKCNAHRYTTD